MIDFYLELNLDREKCTDELNIELSRLESTWKRRELTNPEKATKMLSLILDARKAFHDDYSRTQYDRALDKSKQPPAPVDSDMQRKEHLNRWMEEALKYYQSGQNDLAKEAINNASRYVDSENDDYYHYLLSVISYDNGDLQTSFNAINRGILINPGVADYYIQSSKIYGDLYNARCNAPEYLNEALEYLEKERDALRKAIVLSETSKGNDLLCYSLVLLANSYTSYLGQDLNKAEELARKAMSLGGRTEELDIILQDIESQKEIFQPYKGKNHPSTSTGDSGGACYIATAVYGSYDCPEVRVLRRFRDYRLLQSWYGSKLVKVYYAISPTLVNLFGEYKWFNSIWKAFLDSMVMFLKKKGVSDRQYYDK